MKELSLSDLRRDCKTHGITVKKQTFSHGPSLSFSIGGISTESVLTKTHYEAHKSAFEALVEIKSKYVGATLNGQKVYGLK